MNASDTKLEGAGDSCERWAWGCAALVVVGVLAEFALAICHPAYDSLEEQWGSMLADALIAIGVAGEILFAKMGFSRKNELQRRAGISISEANRRAAEAEQKAAEASMRTAEIEKITAWRRVGEATARELVFAIAPLAGQIDLLVEFQMNDPEAYLFAKELLDVFWRAGTTHVRCNANAYLSGQVFDTWICASPPIDIRSIVDIFSATGIKLGQLDKDLSTHLPPDQKAPNVYLFVGPKLPDFMKAQQNNNSAAA